MNIIKHIIRTLFFKTRFDERDIPILEYKINGVDRLIIPGSDSIDFEFNTRNIFSIEIGGKIIYPNPKKDCLALNIDLKRLEKQNKILVKGFDKTFTIYCFLCLDRNQLSMKYDNVKKRKISKYSKSHLIFHEDKSNLIDALKTKNIFDYAT